MSNVPRPRLTYANVTSTLALFLALGGGAYAATSLPARSVGTTQLKSSAVTRAKIKRSAVNGSKVANESLTGADIKEATLGVVPLAAQATALARVTYKGAPGRGPGRRQPGRAHRAGRHGHGRVRSGPACRLGRREGRQPGRRVRRGQLPRRRRDGVDRPDRQRGPDAGRVRGDRGLHDRDRGRLTRSAAARRRAGVHRSRGADRDEGAHRDGRGALERDRDRHEAADIGARDPGLRLIAGPAAAAAD